MTAILTVTSSKEEEEEEDEKHDVHLVCNLLVVFLRGVEAGLVAVVAGLVAVVAVAVVELWRVGRGVISEFRRVCGKREV